MSVPVHKNPKVSALSAVVVSVGAVPPAHLIVLNQVTVLLPVPSWINFIIKHWPAVSFDIAKVLFPPRVTVCTLASLRSNVTVAPSLLASSAGFVALEKVVGWANDCRRQLLS